MLFPPPGDTPELALIAAAVAEYLAKGRAQSLAASTSGDPHSPWNAQDGWWPNREPFGTVLRFADGESVHDVQVAPLVNGTLRVSLASRAKIVRVDSDGDRLLIDADGERFQASVVPLGEERLVFARGVRRRLRFVDPLAHASEEEPHAGHLMAPMSGSIVAVYVKAGDKVEKGASLCVLESMKMEHTIVAPARGVVTAVNCAVGERVSEGADLVDLEDA